jgi:hypothetical protein
MASRRPGKIGVALCTVSAAMAEANAELGLHGLTLAGSPARAYQEALKNAWTRPTTTQPSFKGRRTRPIEASGRGKTESM